LTCGSDKSLKLWNPTKGLLLQTYSGHGYEVMDCQSSCDSSQIVSASMDKCVLLWDVSTAQVVRRYRAHVATVNCVKFNEDSTVILSASVDGTTKLWDCKSRSKEPIQVLDEAKDSVSSVAVSDHEIITASLDCRVRRYDLRKGVMNCDRVECKSISTFSL
jgi:mitogen-activated protein kinase organizer 1